ncbi:MAG: DNA polymerase III subunit delta, partial [Candidatus Omnitrophica bacterium]|nr:DNA polymerase III subunit delta [Candidatus Omnitrophota bacterium]
ALRDWIGRCVAPGFKEMDLVRFSEPPEDPRLVLEAARTSPFGSPCRVVVVEGLREVSPKSFSWLTEYLTHPNPKTLLVLCGEELERSSGGWHLKPGLEVQWCLPLKGSSLREWVLLRAKRAGKGIGSSAAALLTGRVGSDLQALSQAVEALSLLAGGDASITEAHVEALISPSARETAFDILDAAAAGRPEQAVAQLRQALHQGRLTVEQFMGALGWYYRFLWKTRRRSASQLEEALKEVLEAEVRLKSGVPAGELLADQLLLKLAS